MAGKRRWLACWRSEPAKELTGGPWYTDHQELDTEFVEVCAHVSLAKRLLLTHCCALPHMRHMWVCARDRAFV